ncbi:ABA4-like family protein [Actinokineospora sp. NBRC 105648]|uniref:ABA4-like family protein n=1 Tax=Actinokineospora sp. NBRC 105648 TaxID=3032206 RepID=UPI0024A54873|nr:ABA4-like family protein [Actinokineospora sp. NBRC 105648]GLZ38593.1 hypothetical protein Acsp05_22170 [Actinokineospora sp. NBRC 105648]
MSTLFDLAFYVVAPFWALMVFAPTWSVTHRVISSPLILLPGIVVWAIAAIPVFPDLWAAVSQPTLAKFTAFLGDDNAVTLIWAQVLAWDLFIGRWMYLESRERRIHPLIMGPLLVLTVLLSPIGVPVFLLLRMKPRVGSAV